MLVDTLLEHGELAPRQSLEDVYALAESPFKASVFPASEEQLAWVAEFAASQRDILFAVDEYAYWYPSAIHRPADGFLCIGRTGRHFGQTLILTTQSPGALTKQIMDLSELWVLPLLGVRDSEYILARTQGMIDPRALEASRTPSGTVAARLTLEGRREDWWLDYAGPHLKRI